jgi:hypothetical protein
MAQARKMEREKYNKVSEREGVGAPTNKNTI